MSYNGAVRQPCRLMRGEQGATTHSLHFIKVTYGRVSLSFEPLDSLLTQGAAEGHQALHLKYSFTETKSFLKGEMYCACIWKLLDTLVVLYQRNA